MHERLARIIRKGRLVQRPLLLLAGALVGFLVVITTQLHPPDPESRLPDRYRIAALIQRQQSENEQQRAAVETLRKQLDDIRTQNEGKSQSVESMKSELDKIALLAGTKPATGEGIVVTLDDSSLNNSPTGNVNDLVIHSQDIQAVVNGLWGAGAEAVSINEQRVVSTSAILCVGNTLLLNGTVHSPPYEISAIGANRTKLLQDPLVDKLRQEAQKYSLRFSISSEKVLRLPPYSGPIVPKYAQAKSS